MNNNKSGFTLIETVISVVVIAVIGLAVLLIFFPKKSLSESRNTERTAETNDLLRAVLKYRDDNNGSLPESITDSYEEICQRSKDACSGLADLSVLVQKNYLSIIPTDPQYSGQNGTGYEIKKDTTGRIYVTAPKAESGMEIVVTRQ